MIYQIKSDSIIIGRGAKDLHITRFPFRACYLVDKTTPETVRLLKTLRHAILIPTSEQLLHALQIGIERGTQKIEHAAVLRREETSFPWEDFGPDGVFVVPLYPQTDGPANGELPNKVKALTRCFRTESWVAYSGTEGIDKMEYYHKDRLISNACSKCLNVLAMQAGECHPGSAPCQKAMCLVIPRGDHAV